MSRIGLRRGNSLAHSTMKSSAVFDRSRDGVGKGSRGSKSKATFSTRISITDAVETGSLAMVGYLFETTAKTDYAPQLSRANRRSSSLAPFVFEGKFRGLANGRSAPSNHRSSQAIAACGSRIFRPMLIAPPGDAAASGACQS